MRTKYYLSKKIAFSIFGERRYHNIKSLMVLLHFYFGKDYDDIYAFTSKILSKDAVILDVGANMGQNLLRFSKEFPEGKIICIEPLPVNVSALKFMEKICKINNSVVIEKAISTNTSRYLSIYIPIYKNIPITTQASLIKKENGNVNHDKILVETSTIDEIVEELKLPKVNFIKIDTEGLDAEVLESAKNTISRYLPLIRVENNYIKAKWLEKIGYICFKYIKNKIVRIETTEDNEKYKGDIFYVHKEMFKSITKKFSNTYLQH